MVLLETQYRGLSRKDLTVSCGLPDDSLRRPDGVLEVKHSSREHVPAAIMEASSDSFRVGPCIVSPSLNRVRMGDDEVRLEPKVMEVLVALARRPGEVISRQELLGLVWPDTVVTDDAINRSVSALRRVLGDDSRNPRYIETIPKRGYRLIAEVDWRVRGDSLPLQVPILEMAAQVRRGPARARPWMVVSVVAAVAAIGLWAARPSPTVVLTPRPFTFEPGSEAHPAVSPDGHRIAYSRVPEGEDQARIVIGQAGDSGRLVVSSGPGWESAPVWSEDGTRVTFQRFNDGCEVWSVSALGGPPRLVGPCPNSLYADLAAGSDGTFFFNSRASGGDAFRIVRLEQGRLEPVTSPPPGVWGDHDPVMSPGGEWVAFTRSASEGIQDLYVLDLATRTERRLTFDAREIRGGAWRDADTIVFSSNRETGRQQLWQVRPEGGEPWLLPLADDDASHPSFAGGRLAYVHAQRETGIWRKDLDSGELRRVVSSSGWDMHPDLSPDGTMLAFTSNRSGTYEVWMSAADGTGARPLTEIRGGFTSRPRWSPDGARILFASRPDGNADLFLVDVASGTIDRLTHTSWEELGASWSVDGSAVYFSSNEGGLWRGKRMDLTGAGVPSDLGLQGAMGMLEGIDGLYHARMSEAGIWRSSSEGVTQVIDDLDTRDWGSFSVQDSRLVYYRRGAGVASLDMATGTDSVLWVPEFPVPGHDPALAVSADGRWLFLGQRERDETDVMVVDLGGR